MNGLEALEIVKYECGFAFGGTANGDRVRESLPVIEKELKALEIIKAKKVDVDTFIFYTKQHNLNDEWVLRSYNDWVAGNEINLRKKILTKDEFDLLKEVMKC